MKTTSATVMLPLALASILGLSGCGKIRQLLFEKAAEKAIETGTGGQVDLSSSSGTITITDPNTGAKVQGGNAAKLPDGWPAKVPVYPGSTIQASLGTPSGKTVMLVTKDDVAKVSAFYKSALSSMKMQADMDVGTGRVTSYKDGNTTVGVTITGGSTGPGSGGCAINLSVNTGP